MADLPPIQSKKSTSLPNMWRSDLSITIPKIRSNHSLQAPITEKVPHGPKKDKDSSTKSSKKKLKSPLTNQKKTQQKQRRAQTPNFKMKFTNRRTNTKNKQTSAAENAERASEAALNFVSPEVIRDWHAERSYGQLTKEAVDAVYDVSQGPPMYDPSAKHSCKKYSEATQLARKLGDFTQTHADGAARLYLAMQDRGFERRHSQRSKTEIPQNIDILSDVYEKLSFKGDKEPNLYKKSQIPSLFENIQAIDRTARDKVYKRLWAAQPTPSDQTRRSVYEVKDAMRRRMNRQPKVVMQTKKIFLPNEYEVPSNKSRMKFRSHINSVLRRYKLPWHGVYHDVLEDDVTGSITRKCD